MGVHASSTPDQLRAKRAQLVAELATLSPDRHAAGGALSAAEDAFNLQQAKLNAMRAQMDALNAQLAGLARAISDDQVSAASARKTLASLTRATYESASDNSMMAAVFSAKDFSSAMDSLQGAAHVTSQIQDLENTLNAKETDLQNKRRTLQSDFAQASSLENQLSAESNRLMAIVEQRNLIANGLTGRAREIAGEIANIDYQLNPPAPASSGGPFVPPSGGGGCANRFAFGQCTWYVASRRCIPWGGNADAWFFNAGRMGFSEGHVPVPGAVVVWWPGRGGASGVGHVGYVEAVGPGGGIPAGSFKLSEMNWAGWDRVDYRIVVNDPGVFQGFIYGHS